MENQELKKWNGRIWSGLFLLVIGGMLLLQRSGVLFPEWLFKWPMILIIIGTFIGLRHGFRGPAWAILILIGSIFLFDLIEPAYALRRYSFPLVIMGLGLFMIFRPRVSRPMGPRPWQARRWQHQEAEQIPRPLADTPDKQEGFAPQDYIDSVAIFGGVRKVIVSKNFKGGEAFALFGGHEIDLSQADISGKVVLEVTQIFGGTKLLLPAYWDVKSEMVAVFGGIEDKRQIMPGATNPDKLLILKGTSIFGGIDIRNY